MAERATHRDRLRALEFEAFVAGAGGRLLHSATLLTGEPSYPPGAYPRAERLLYEALARTYADWDRLHGGDPYDRARRELALRFAREARRHQRPRGGLLDRLTPVERLVLVLRMYEEVGEEQTAALLGLPADRVRAVTARAVATLRAGGRRPGAAPTAPHGTAGPRPAPDSRATP
ncbi:RNA polymerase [Streptomyces anulatus]|uniref:sigma factor-like helix-turn-helix DNA-binding protein n=1 Tax=Streptomyces TaxID=1883 RepID=UPI002055F5E3|nr:MULTISPECIES: sigma factor-like helix-turn-helix DNA-binding protein [Streptomyces]UPT44293.1 RNA polymerase [Streptomyces sp. WAC00303]WIY78464.1 sigma factor-like helix-turn-helix DNA-binding protein [Streptomyces anulatus]